jgi:hypothetical protein
MTEASLEKRSDGMLYDTALDITWQQNAGASSHLSYDAATAWAESMVFGGFCAWRLPMISELRHMYFNNLGGVAGSDLTGDRGPVDNIQTIYWSIVETEGGGPPGLLTRIFDFSSGQESSVVLVPPPPPPLVAYHSAWAVRAGDVSDLDNTPTHFEIDTDLVTGTIVTNGTLGALAETDIVNWDLTMLFPNIGPLNLSGDNSDITNWDSSPLTATPAGLVFDFNEPSSNFVISLRRPDPGDGPPIPAAALYWQLANELEEIVYGCCSPGSFEILDRAVRSPSGLAAVGVNPLGMCDADFDLVSHNDDNCTDVANADQRDTDGDQIGNACDADISVPNDCLVNVIDMAYLKAAYFAKSGAWNWNPDADFNGDGTVNAIDLGILKMSFFEAPGPSGLSNQCNN